MPLTTAELKWVTDCINIYKIPYQEVYDEVLDHILSAIEQAREAGNVMPIERLFQNVVDDHFNGYIGIDEIVKAEEKSYRNKVTRIFWRNFRSVLDWKAMLFIVISMLISHFLPAKILVTKLLLVPILIMAFVPLIYVYRQTRIIKVSKGKRSLIRTNIIANCYLPFTLFQLYINIPNCIDDINDNKTMHNFILNHPEIAALILSLTLVYSISSIYLCREELQPYRLTA